MAKSFLNFVEVHDTGKTKVWDVLNSNDYLLGKVKWFANWRKYCFFSYPDLILDDKCLNEITEFIVKKNKEHKKK